MAGVDVGTAYLQIVPSAKGFSANLTREIGGGMESAGKDAGAKAVKGFGGAFKAGMAGVVAGLGLDRLLSGAIGFAQDSIAEARDSQKVGALTQQVIKTTGGAAKVSAAQVGDLATAISNKTGIDDEAIQSGANLLLTFKNVKNEVGAGANIFDRATQAATDLSSAGFGDMSATSKQLGKALNDPIAGISALARSGVTFTDQQKEQIKTLVESGDTLGAQKIILGEVESQVGGAAAASATAGEKMSTAFGNFKERVGTALLPLVDKFATFMTSTAIPAMSKFVTEFTNGTGPGGQFRDTIKDIAEKAMGMAKWIGENGDKVKALVITVGSAVAIFKTVTTAINVWKTAQLFLNLVMSANPIGLIVIAVAALAAGIVWVATQTTIFQDAWKIMTDAISAAWRWLWNSILAPIIRWILDGFGNIADGIGDFLEQLSHIPGFGWAKDAADKMHGAADKAHNLARGIEDIPDTKKITITWDVKADAAARQAINFATNQASNKRGALLDGMRAHGGDVWAGGAFAVGDNPDGSWNPTTEVFVPKTAGTILNQSQLAALGVGGGMTVHNTFNTPTSPDAVAQAIGWKFRGA